MPIPDFNGVRVAVTGGAGFIGSHLVDALVERGAKVTVLDDLSAGFERNLEAVRGRIRLLKGDIRDPEACRQAVEGAGYVFHQAARGSVPRSMADPAGTIDINVRGTATVFTACRDAKVPAVLYASSSSVYGDSTTLPKKEGEEGKPLSPYAFSKVADEQMADVFSRCFGMRILGLRYFNVYGPRQDPNGPCAAVVPRFFAAVRRGEPPTVYGNGEQSRDFTYVSDVVEANLLAAGAPDDYWGRAYNVAPGSGTTVNALASAVITACGGGPAPVYLPPRQGDILHSLADSSAARASFGFEAHVSLGEGLLRMGNESP
jgi:nucleoside-diphosphate-sugar epimerase